MSTQLHPLPGWASDHDEHQQTEASRSGRQEPHAATRASSEHGHAAGPDKGVSSGSSRGLASDRQPREHSVAPVPAIVQTELGREGLPTALESYGAWIASMGMHLLLLFALSLIVLSLDSRRPEAEIDSVFTPLEDVLLTEIEQAEDTWNTDSDIPVIATTATAVIEKSVRKVDPVTTRPSEFGMPELPDQVTAIVPDMETDDMDEVVPGILGETVTTDGDVGSVDRITTEILAALRESKVLVVWLLDASESLRTRREQVIGRFDRVYQEIGELGEHDSDALLTSVVGFGKTATLMTKKPTADPDELRKAVRGIPVDNTGIENVFSAVQTAAMEYRVQARKGYRVMLVVLTDESGNDPELADKTMALVKEHKMPVYVLGPVAPFSRRQIHIRWVDSETSEVFHLPVERGPATAVAEYPVSLFTLFAARPVPVMSSGFGPFGLAKLAHESGGICFVYNDGHIRGPAFDPTVLNEYAPDYVSETEYRRLVEQHPLRNSVLTCSLALQEADFPQPKTEFLAGGIQFEIRDSFRKMESSYDALDQVAQELISVKQSYERETSARWRAHYDLLLGQVLIRRLQIESSVPLLNEMFAKPRSCRDVASNAFALSGIKGTSLLDRSESDAAAETGNGQTDQADPESDGVEREGVSELAQARLHLERVVQDHAGTPWSVIAQAELESPLVVEWRETFVEPPDGQPLPWDKPPGEWKELSDEDKAKLEAAKEKFERFRRFRAEQKKKMEELARKSGATKTGKKREPPKL